MQDGRFVELFDRLSASPRGQPSREVLVVPGSETHPNADSVYEDARQLVVAPILSLPELLGLLVSRDVVRLVVELGQVARDAFVAASNRRSGENGGDENIDRGRHLCSSGGGNQTTSAPLGSSPLSGCAFERGPLLGFRSFARFPFPSTRNRGWHGIGIERAHEGSYGSSVVWRYGPLPSPTRAQLG